MHWITHVNSIAGYDSVQWPSSSLQVNAVYNSNSFPIRKQENWNSQIPSFSASILKSYKRESTWILLNLYWLMHSSYCHLTDDKNLKENGKKTIILEWSNNKSHCVFCLPLKVNSEQDQSHMERDPASCIKVSRDDGYVSDRNTVLSKLKVGFE